MRRHGRALAAAVLVLAACGYPPPPVDVRTRLGALASGRVPAGDTWPVGPREAEMLLVAPDLEVMDARPTAGGSTGAYRVRVRVPGHAGTLLTKWKSAPPGADDAYNDSPRRELASYRVQQWVLPPSGYVVPTIAVRCLPVPTARRIEPDAMPTLPDTTCVLGTLALWLRHVHVPDPIYDPARFVRDPRYAHHLANFNLVTYLVEHQDGKADNFLVADDPHNPRLFSVDNGITFGNLRHNYLVTNWNRLYVPALTRHAITRLRAVGPEDLAALATVAELQADATGRLWPVPPGRCRAPDAGVRWSRGVLQLGLTAEEIAGVAERIASVLARVDAGEIPLLD